MSLPPYSESSEAPPAYPNLLPEKFTIGNAKLPPLVRLDELVAHLRVLGAFRKLRTTVESANSDLDAASAWTVFLCRAVYRFEKWVLSMDVDIDDRGLPPLDVLMVWHSYMLNPLAYEEDGVRGLSQLKYLQRFPFKEAIKAIDAETLQLTVSEATRNLFEATTKEPFDMPVVTSPDDKVSIPCPCCDDNKKTFLWPWIDDTASGWAQRDFRARCPDCKQIFNHESYGVRKFCEDAVKWRNAQGFSGTRNTVFLAGTGYPSIRGKAPPFLQRILSHIPATATGAGFARAMKWKLTEVEKWMMQPFGRTIRTRPPRIAGILRRYSFPGPFSIELTAAVMRQGAFIEKMDSIRWTHPAHFRDDAGPLIRSVARYHAFLELMWHTPGSFLVPTLDIDLAWHTHQLKAEAYRAETKRILGVVLNHDDKVEENTLSNGFDATAEAWRRRYGVPYSICGCVASAETTVSRTMRLAAAVLTVASSHNERPDLITTDEEDADGTHPSEHNSILVNTPTASEKREARELKHLSMLEKQAKDVAKGRADVWTIMRERRRTRSEDGSTATRGKHSGSFFHPVPYWGVSPEPYGTFGFSGSACGAYGGAVAFTAGLDHNNTSSCAVGVGGAFCNAEARGDFAGCGASHGLCGTPHDSGIAAVSAFV